MSTQISVRLADYVVSQLDALVASGAAASRAEVVESALEAELRRRLYARDAEIYREQGEDPELEGLGEWMRNRAIPPLGD
jgi:Arc/MetJ-type ribon-helix-helix transcriptional regulator